MPERPTGTVTFLFTDIEGSTRLLQQLRERYDDVQSRHAEILRAAFSAHGGHEIDTQGDAFFAAFGRARDAVAAAVEAQRALAEEDWPQQATVRVRMGLHTGEPLVGGERYVGMGVNRGARICSAAHGGQVLLSNTTRELVEDDLPGDVRIVDLGEHQLKDLPRPERIFQLAVDGLPSSFPPLRAGEAPKLVKGRERELARAAAAASSRLTFRVTLLTGAAILIVAGLVSAFVLGARSPGAKVAANSVAAIDSSGNITKSVAVGATPVALASSSNALWVANLGDRTITHVDPSTGQAVGTISVGQTPAGIAASKSSVWVAAGWNELDQIDPQYDRLTAKHVVKTIGSSFGSVDRPAVVAFGSLWVVNPDGYVQQMDPRSLTVKSTVDVGNNPTAIAAGAGFVWVANEADGTVTRIDPTALVTTTIPVGHGPAAVSVGAGGIWVANSGDNAVVRIDPSTNAVAGSVRVGNGPDAVLAVPGAVWVANAGDGTVMRVAPASDTVTKTIHLGATPTALAGAGGRVWVAAERAPASTPAQGGVARLTSDVTIRSLDPALDDGSQTSIFYATCAGLVTYPDKPAPQGSRVVPEIAEALPVPRNGGTTYTFRIRHGFRFSPPSNAPVTAESMKETIDRIRNPRMKSGIAPSISDIRSVTASGHFLTIRLAHPDGGFLDLLASTPVCAVPSGTPIDPQGINDIPSAGPYYIASYTPNQQLVLKRNPNYRGDRPHRLDEIVWTLGVDPSRGLAQVEAGKADYVAGDLPSTGGPALAAKYGPGSPAAKSGHQQYFINTLPGGRWLHMNVSRPLFANPAMRKAVNYAIDRSAIVAEDRKFYVLNPFNVGAPTDDILPPATTGAKNYDVYPLHPDLAKARRLVGRVHRTAIMYAATNAPWPQEARLIADELKPLGIDVQIKTFPIQEFFALLAHRGEPFDLAVAGWSFQSPDPSNVLTGFDGRTIGPQNNNDFSYFQSPRFDAQLTAASKLSGPRRYRTYDGLALELERDYAPVAALATATSRDFFSARIGCQVYQPVFGIDLAALCLRH